MDRIKRKLRTYKEHFFEGIGWLMGEQIFTSALGLVLTAALAYSLSATDFGTYKYILSLVGFLTIFTVPGMSIILVRSIAHGFHGTTADLIKYKSYWCVGAVAITASVAGYYLYRDNILLGTLVLIASIGMPLTAILANYVPILHGYQKFRQLSIANIVVRIIHYSAVIVAAVVTKNLIIIIATYYIALAIAEWVILRYAFSNIVIQGGEIDPNARKFSTHYSLLDAFSLLSQHIDKILIFQYIGAAEVALYSIAITPPDLLRGFMKNISSFLMPRIAKYTNLTFVQHLTNHVLPGTIVSTVITLLYVIASPFLIPLIFPMYSGAVYYSQIYALSLLAVILYPQAIINIKGGLYENYFHKIISGVVRIVAIWIGLAYFGMLGIIWAQVISSFITLFILFFMVRRVTQ